MTADAAIRLAAIAQLVVLLGCGFAWITAVRDHLPRVAWLVGWGFGYLVAALAGVIALNAVLAETVTTGQRVFTVLLVPATLLVGGCTVHEIRARARQVGEVMAWFDHLEHTEPCSTPGCQQRRTEALEMTRRWGWRKR